LTVAQIVDLVSQFNIFLQVEISQFNIFLQVEISRMIYLSLEGSEVGKKHSV